MKLQNVCKLWFVMAMLVLLTTSGCTRAPSVKRSLGKIETKIKLKPGEFIVIGAVTGEASCPYLFWLENPFQEHSYNSSSPVPFIAFELGNPHLRKRAMQDLYSKHDLQGKPQVLHNIIEEWSVASYLGLFAILKVSVMAEIIEFRDQGEL
jgi:hypothetical protein